MIEAKSLVSNLVERIKADDFFKTLRFAGLTARN